ncbi:Protein of unknown function [Pyronema omphalodes CBS 100304]|uniref:Uncharacterized protein n=1 Tax=Pyronema omphalodes (strain CBS 100304) TaxID=1076935 RepID=U4LD31_PYROM|nr:Protein of unknown function [Pyronema omphalodes CBS 100304]
MPHTTHHTAHLNAGCGSHHVNLKLTRKRTAETTTQSVVCVACEVQCIDSSASWDPPPRARQRPTTPVSISTLLACARNLEPAVESEKKKEKMSETNSII